MSEAKSTKTLVDRLREWRTWGQIETKAIEEAADEIERLHAALHRHACSCKSGEADLRPEVHDAKCEYRQELLP